MNRQSNRVNRHSNRRGFLEIAVLILILILILYLALPLILVGYGIYKNETEGENSNMEFSLKIGEEQEPITKEYNVIKFYLDNKLKYIDVKSQDELKTFVFSDSNDEKLKSLAILVEAGKAYKITTQKQVGYENEVILDLEEIKK